MFIKLRNDTQSRLGSPGERENQRDAVRDLSISTGRNFVRRHNSHLGPFTMLKNG